MATVIGMDTETGWQHQLAVYTLKLLVKFGIKYLPGQIYMAVLRTNTDRSHQVVPYDSGPSGHGTQFPIVFVHRIIGCIISPIDWQRIKVGEQIPGPGGYTEYLYCWKSMLVNWNLLTSFPYCDLSPQIWMKLHSKCVTLDIALQQVEGWRAEYIFSKCLNLKMVEAETKASDVVRGKAKVKLAEHPLQDQPP